MDLKRTNYSSGAPLEDIVGYSRAVKAGPFVYIGGTTSVQADGSVYGEGDSYAQVKYILEKLIKIAENAGAAREDIYSVKMYSTPDFNGKEGMRAYTEFFKDIKPLCTGVTVAALNRKTQLVEIELNAIIGCGK